MLLVVEIFFLVPEKYNKIMIDVSIDCSLPLQDENPGSATGQIASFPTSLSWITYFMSRKNVKGFMEPCCGESWAEIGLLES